ncbi:hypothetical protein MMC26_003178 [Xylographa opegraphella]|nr:hypothetical protein [Xylographa opegraphella]
MPITRIDICDLIHTLLEEGLELSTSCSIVLTHNLATGSILDEIAAVSKLPTFVNLWVQRSGRLRLSITLVLDAISSNCQQKEIFQKQLEKSFANAELWRQLGLQCSYLTPIDKDFFSNGTRKIEMILFHTEATYVATKGFKNHIIANTRPPDGVPNANLHEISIIWALSSIASSSTERDNKRLNGGTSLANTDRIVSALGENDSDRYISLSQPNPRLPLWDAEHQCDWLPFMTVTSVTDAQMLDEVVDEESIVLSTQASAPQVPQQQQRLEIYRKRPRSICSPLFDVLAAQKLIDTAFQEIICGRKIPDLPTADRAKVVARPKLAEISPALFSPGYLQAMSRHSQCICTIAYSMAFVNGRATSKPLKDAFALLWDTASNIDLFIGEPPSREARTPAEGLASIIKARTWLIMQKGLFEPAAAATLKPLSYGVSQAAENPLQTLDECSSPVTLVATPKNSSSPATEILDDFCLSDEDFEPLFEDSDDEILLDEYEVDPSIHDTWSHRTNHASSDGLSARPPMTQPDRQSSAVADDPRTKAMINRAQHGLLDTLIVSDSDVREPTDTGSPFEALDSADVSSIGRAESADMPPDLDAEEMLLDNPSNDGGSISAGDAFLDAMEMLDRLSVDEGRAAGNWGSSEPDEMLDVCELGDGVGGDWLG